MAGLNDPRCPIRQIENYLHRLDELGTPYELYTYEAGHGALVTEERIHQMKLELAHLARHVPAGARRRVTFSLAAIAGPAFAHFQ